MRDTILCVKHFLRENTHQKNIYQKLVVVISIRWVFLFCLSVLSEMFLQSIFIIFEMRRKEVCTKSCTMKYMLYWKNAQCSEEVTNFSEKVKENLATCLSHANQMQCMALFGSWSKQTNCKNIYKASEEIWTLTGYLTLR